jgi:hypothetical protein
MYLLRHHRLSEWNAVSRGLASKGRKDGMKAKSLFDNSVEKKHGIAIAW